MPKSLTRLEFDQLLQTNVEWIAESRVMRLMELQFPDLDLAPADIVERSDGTLSLSTARLRAYVGLVAGEVLAAFDEVLLDVVYAEDEAPPA
ncbi:MAG: hypothetical protein OXC99_02320 [Chloroflexi bacterium]|nr:hypothetical protein [Chloroflexota bacterium]